MKLLKSYLYGIVLLVALSSSCQENKHKQMDAKMDTTKNTSEFYWQENLNCPLGFPIEVYKGGLETENGNYVSLSIGPSSGIKGWGSSGSGMSSGIKPVPDRLNLIWISFAENTFYDINCKIDHDKMVKLFEEGYIINFKNKKKKITYDTIIVGFAPGGVVVVWLYGKGRQVEIGRYQAQKAVISEEEISKLDSHDRLLFDENNSKKMMSNKNIVPLEIQKENKPIPYGLWDTYREKYNWRPVFVIQKEGKVNSAVFSMFNGEMENLEQEELATNDFKERAILKRISFDWFDVDHKQYGAEIFLNEEEVFKAYKEIYKDNKNAKAELVFKVNIPNTFVVVSLKSDSKEIALVKTIVKVY